jgi:hypothetical protein
MHIIAYPAQFLSFTTYQACRKCYKKVAPVSQTSFQNAEGWCAECGYLDLQQLDTKHYLKLVITIRQQLYHGKLWMDDGCVVAY